MSSRIEREKHTVAIMIALYCRSLHKEKGAGQCTGQVAAGAEGPAAGSDVYCQLCPECRELLDYAWLRLSRCKFGEGKTTCQRCPIHCYKPVMKQRIAAVMRYSGPRMLLHHPLAALRHLLQR